jgi:hypothetical protein
MAHRRKASRDKALDGREYAMGDTLAPSTVGACLGRDVT